MAVKNGLKSLGSPLASMSICEDKIICRDTYDETANSNPSTIPALQKGTAYTTCDIAATPGCSPFSLTNIPAANSYMAGLVAEHLNIGAADVNVYRMLGVHEQCKLVDSTGLGSPLSNGFLPGYPPVNAFDKFQTEWRSLQKGDNIQLHSYIGYDFGAIKVSDRTRDMYGVDTGIRKHITAFAIKQSDNAINRVTKVRVERSDDGKVWYGVALVDLPDDNCLNTILYKHSVPMRYWRLRPLNFNGGVIDYWGVQALQLFHNYQLTTTSNIQDKVFLENRDRQYATDSTLLKGYYDLVSNNEELSKFGIELPSQMYTIDISFAACIQLLGRPIIIGDILELPSETWYSSELRAIKKWVEVTDVSWSQSGYTPGWKPTLLRVIAMPAYASQETQDIFGDLAAHVDSTGLMDKNDGNGFPWQDYNDSTQTVVAEAKNAVPERGQESTQTIRQFTAEEVTLAKAQKLPNLNKIGLNQGRLYSEDGIPPNNAPFTEGDTYPANPVNGDYHRLTYSTLSKWYPPQLHRYSDVHQRWIYLETDRRQEFNAAKPVLTEFTQTPHSNLNITKPYDPLTDCEK
jgi:hypothetical protein